MVDRIPVMDGRIPPKRKKPVSQKRVAVVLASLVGTMTVSAAVLLLMEGGALGTAMPGWAAPVFHNPSAWARPLIPVWSNRFTP